MQDHCQNVQDAKAAGLCYCRCPCHELPSPEPPIPQVPQVPEIPQVPQVPQVPSDPDPFPKEENPGAVGSYGTFKIQSAYYGELPVTCLNLGNGYVSMTAPLLLPKSRRTIYIKEIDASANNLNENTVYTMKRLFEVLSPTTVNINECKRHGLIIQNLRAKQAKGPLTILEKELLHASLIHNNVVDIHFGTCDYLSKFLIPYIGEEDLLPGQPAMISLHNMLRLDNAFFTGSYMCYGNGATSCYPLGTFDILAHELGHAIVQLIAGSAMRIVTPLPKPIDDQGLVYQGESGAQNEGFADIIASCYEQLVYEQFPNMPGVPDFLIGEDSGKAVPFFRDMENPLNSTPPQPISFKDPVRWVDPNSTADYGGVHTNSSVLNVIFSDTRKLIGLRPALKLFVSVLRNLKPLASFIDLRDALLRLASPTQLEQVRSVLNTRGLSSSAVSNWVPKPQNRGLVITNDEGEQIPNPVKDRHVNCRIIPERKLSRNQRKRRNARKSDGF